MQIGRSEERLNSALAEITRLLRKHMVLQTLTHRQEGTRRDLLDQLQHRQNLAEVASRCRVTHPADLAFILEMLPRDDRALVWSQVAPEQQGDVLVEVSDAVRPDLVGALDREAMVAALAALDPEDLAFLSGSVPEEEWRAAYERLDQARQSLTRAAADYPDGAIGALMRGEMLALREVPTVGEAIEDLRRRPPFPDRADTVFVVDTRSVLRGGLALADLIRADAAAPLATIMRTELVTFGPNEDADVAVKAFDRYNLLSAPVVDDRGKLLGQLTSDVVAASAREEAARATLRQAGLRGEEDLFAPVIDSARNRWPWLAINLLTAFIASTVIAAFEQTIQQLVALAALMPIVASVGGNTGNQTIALVIRGLALDQLRSGRVVHFARKELTVALVNGLLWGTILGIVAVAVYGHWTLGLVMATAVMLNLAVAALIGVAVPVVLERAGRDPAQGASVLLTFITDSMGFLLFLGLAWAFLV